MAKASLLSLSLSLLLLFHGCLAARNQQYQQQNACQIDRLDSLEPSNRVKYEAGTVETWDPSHKQFQCAGVAMMRHTIEPNGLLLPSFTNTPQLMYVIQGQGMTGVMFSGCPETYQAPQGSQSQSRFQDQHQKIRRFRTGDILALPAGVAHWCYNDGNQPVVVVSVLDLVNSNNQLDNNPRKFHLAGNPRQEEFQTQQQQRQQDPYRGASQECNNIFCGFDPQILAEAFNVDERLIRKLQNENDNRGVIVRVKGELQVVRPPRTQKEQQQYEESDKVNGLEETFCTMKLRENIGDPSRADIYTRQAGHVSTVSSLNLPILRWIELSAEKGKLHRNAIMVPHWNINAHSVIYAIGGSCQVQVVDNYGRSVFDGELRQGQILVVPQNFAVVKRARGQDFEWVSFKTHDNAMISPLSGRTSVLRGMPEEVLANAFQISREDARRIKFNNQQTTLIPGSQSSREMRDDA